MEAIHPVPELVWAIFSLLLVALSVYLVSRRTHLPFTVMLVVVGIAINFIGHEVPALSHIEDTLSISPDLILFVFLPTLIFESSYNLDARQLRHNSAQILALAIPGLLLSTGLIGVIIWQALDIDLIAALLMGALLSATDPVAVIALFRQIGAPGRLSTLIEGESLFNDATALVVSKILLTTLVIGALSQDQLVGGVFSFVTLFAGGLIFGVLLGYLTGKLIGWIDSDPIVEIGLTTTLAYLSFLIAEEVLHISGVMATLGAGLTIGTWGKLRITSSVRVYLEHFWTVLAFTANAFLFLLLGMQVDIPSLASSWDLILWVIVAMLVSRAFVIFGLLPLFDRLPKVDPVGIGYRFIMFWGGLRGAIALAIVLSLPDYPFKELFVALVTGAVLFTLLAQGLTMQPLLRLMKLDQPPLADRLALLEREITAHQRAIKRLPALHEGGLFSSRITQRLNHRSQQAIAHAKHEIHRLREEHLTPVQEFNLFFLRALTEENSYYREMFERGHLSESVTRRLLMMLEHQIDSLRYDKAFHNGNSRLQYEYIEHWLFSRFSNTPVLRAIVEHMRLVRISRYYETVWGHFQGSRHVLHSIDQLSRIDSTPTAIVSRVREHYRHWNHLATDKLHRLNHDFPEFALLMQERLGKRIVLLSEVETTREQARHGTIPQGMAEEIEADLIKQLKRLRGHAVQLLNDDPEQLLKRVPLFARLPDNQLRKIATACEPITLEKHDYLVHQGSRNDTLFIVSRGTVRLQHYTDGEEHRLSTLIAGDSFGESALLGEGHADVSVIAQTPSRLYTLSRERLGQLMQKDPELRDFLAERDHRLKKIHDQNHTVAPG
ncbi:MAG: cyclic nucleotide-binding domain-containing protein [Oceanospirillales bacterium]|nr:cyclic nucleotide-binding domain-containing protein [Oceanospirillales bacterium]